MLHKLFGPGDWFAPKRFGYGAGLPIAWQGWLVLSLFVLALCGLGLLPVHSGVGRLGQFIGAVALILLFILICARHTRGGWRWRWGED